MSAPPPDVVVAGLQPSRALHLGNFVGALRTQAAHAGPGAFCFVADLQAQSSGRADPQAVDAAALDTAAVAIALGLAEPGTHLYRQSDVPEVLQLQWLIGGVVPLEALEADDEVRARRERGTRVTASELAHALLMTADIVAVGATKVVVGVDQEQHVRMCRSFARALNEAAGTTVVCDTFTRVVPERARLLLGHDGRKMSRTAGNGLPLGADRDTIERFLGRAHSDGVAPSRADDCVFVNVAEALDTALAARLRAGYVPGRAAAAWLDGARQALLRALDGLMAPWRAPLERYRDTDEGQSEVLARLDEGAAAAREVARQQLRAVRTSVRVPPRRGVDPPAPPAPGAPAALSYSEYIQVPALLRTLAPPATPPRGVDAAAWPWTDYAPSRAAAGLPGEPQSPAWQQPPLPTSHPAWSHDEVLFITVHQTFELWFRHALWELDDMTRRVLDTAASAGLRPLPQARLMARRLDRAPRLDAPSRVAAYPRLDALCQAIEADAAAEPALGVYANWIRESPPPGLFPLDADAAAWPVAPFVDLLPLCVERIERATSMVSLATRAYDVLRRMRPASFLDFRARLDPASGFGSSQFRELEIFSGQRERHLGSFATLDASGRVVDDALWDLAVAHAGGVADASEIAREARTVLQRSLPADELARVRARMLAPTLRDLVYAWLVGCAGDAAARLDLADRLAAASFRELYDTARRRRSYAFDHATHERDVWRAAATQLAHTETLVAAASLAGDATVFPDPTTRAALATLLDACLRLDEAILAWRQAHLVFVEVMIGGRPGTGGGGLSYLQETMKATRGDYVLRAVPAVWASRSLLVPHA